MAVDLVDRSHLNRYRRHPDLPKPGNLCARNLAQDRGSKT